VGRVSRGKAVGVRPLNWVVRHRYGAPVINNEDPDHVDGIPDVPFLNEVGLVILLAVVVVVFGLALWAIALASEGRIGAGALMLAAWCAIYGILALQLQKYRGIRMALTIPIAVVLVLAFGIIATVGR
jgi:hypothetical protein